MRHWRPRFTLRSKLALLAILLLALPWVAHLYVKEMERFLLESQQQSLLATARAVATALHDRPQLMGLRPRRFNSSLPIADSLLPGEELLEPLPPQPMPPPDLSSATDEEHEAEIEAILKGLERASSRIWVINRDLRVLALAGDLSARQSSEESPQESDLWRKLWLPVLNWMMPPHSARFHDELDPGSLAGESEIYEALLGIPGARTRPSSDGKGMIVSAAYPIWSGDMISGVVVAEESTHTILSLRSQAIERLLLLTVAGFVIGAILVFGFASRLSSRIRKLRDEAETAVDAQGHFCGLLAESAAQDELGDLSRSFSALLSRLSQHQTYLESMAGRLSHELRTPIAVVRSSLENLREEFLPETSLAYMDRADAGLKRLSRILTRMSEATRMEQALAATEAERFDLRTVVSECVNGYRVVYPGREFIATLPAYPVRVHGAPDLAAQMLDKLVENAADFALENTPIRIELAFGTTSATLSVSNLGPVLPPQIREQLFESMVTARSRDAAAEPHLGLGLFVARMIAAFHGGTLKAENLAENAGVRMSVEIRLT